MNQKTGKILKILLTAGSILAAVKMIFVDYTLDEEYQIVMAYRRLMGDTLFGTMWEPHQTSAFACVGLMRLYRALTGTTTGVVIFLRVCTTGIQFLLSWLLYRVLCKLTKRDYAFLLGACYFNIVPKIIEIPEFSNLQVWFFTVIILALLHYYKPWENAEAAEKTKMRGQDRAAAEAASGERKTETQKGKAAGKYRWFFLVLAGIGMAFEVLSYPACLVLFPLFLIFIFALSPKKNRIRDCLIFGGTCGVSAVLWLGAVLREITGEEFLRNIRYVLQFDLTHDMSVDAKYRTTVMLRDIKVAFLLFLVIGLVSFLIWGLLCLRGAKEKKKPGLPEYAVIAVLVSEMVQMYYWLALQKGYEEPQIEMSVILAGALLVWGKADERKKALLPCLAGAALTIAAVVYMSDLGICYSVPHGMLGVLFGLLVIVYALEKQLGERSRFWAYLLLFGTAFFAMFGKGFTLRAGKTATNTILGIDGMARKGPAAGIFMNYMQGHIINCTYEEFQEYVDEGQNCLVVTNMLGTAGTTAYLFRNTNVCHFSIVDPTSYDEKLLTYWELYPQKQPDVILVDCWFGELKEAPDSWIMQYIEKDFPYQKRIDGQYVRYYKRKKPKNK